jgi:hypothetical protein
MSAAGDEAAYIALVTGGRARVGASGVGEGRGLFATAAFAPGETVFVEQPLVCAPAEFGQWECVCHACLQRETDDAPLTACKRCRWAHFCSAGCAASGAAAHTDAECAAMVQLRYRREDYPGTVLLASRLLRDDFVSDPVRAAQAALARTLVGASEHVPPHVPPLTLQRFEAWAPVVLALSGCASACTEDAVDALCRLLRNEFKTLDERGVAAGAALYPATARMNHACTPNVCARASGWDLRLEALVALAAGDELRLSYTDDEQTAAERAAHLRARFLFDCACGAPNCASNDGR